MSRSSKKGPFVDPQLHLKVEGQKRSGSRDPIKTWARASTIVPDMVGHNFSVHQGKTFIKVFVTEDMVGHRLGEFAPTRFFRGHPGHRKEAAPAAAK